MYNNENNNENIRQEDWKLFLKVELQKIFQDDFGVEEQFHITEDGEKRLANLEEFSIYPPEWFVYYWLFEESDEYFNYSREFDTTSEEDLRTLQEFKMTIATILIANIKEVEV